MSTAVIFHEIVIILLTITTFHASSANINNINFHFFVIFSSPLPSPSAVDEESISVDNLATFHRVSTRLFQQNNKQTTVHFFRVTFSTASQEATPLGIVKLTAALRAERFAEKSPSLRRRFILIIGRGAAVQRAIVAVRSAFPHSETSTKNPVTIFVYDEDFFNHANVTGSIYQLNHDRRTLVAPLLASTVLHRSNPKGGLVVLIHDLTMASDQLFIAAHSLFNTLVLVTEDQSEDVVSSNLRNEIAPILSNVLLTQTIPAATFVVHVANSRSIAKIFAAANRINLLSHKYIWIISDKSSFIADNRTKKSAVGSHLKQPVKSFIMPQSLVALDIDRKRLFEIAFARLLNGLAKSLAASLSRLKGTTSPRLWYRFTRTGGYFPDKQLDLAFSHLFEADGSVISGDRRGGGRYHSEDAKHVTAVQVSIDRFGVLRVEKASLRSSTMQRTVNTTTPAVLTTVLQVPADKDSTLNNGSGKSALTETSEIVITDSGSADDIIPHLLQVYISLGPPFLFVKPLSELTGECQGPSSVVCDQIIPGEVLLDPLTAQTPAHRCCSGLVPDLVRSLSKDLKVNAHIVVSAVGGDTIANTTVALDMLNKRIVDMVFTADPYIQHRSATRYYVTDPFFTSSYAMMVAIRRKEPSLFAFLSPFPFSVWIGILLMLAPVTAVSLSQFEWNSPFGLNPWGRKRVSNYTLGSALNMVYALLFGHTVKTKCPKAWPSKWTQNFWAGFAIFVIASYTGNLASFLAKRHESVEYDSIYDLANADHAVKVGVVRDDPIIVWLRLAVSHFAGKLVVLETLDEAVRHLRTSELEVVIGELATLRYWQITDDATTCSTKLLPRTFADRELAPAMLVDSQFRATVAGKMREYKTTGEFEQLVTKNRFVSLSLLQGGGTACGDQNDIGGSEWARQAADTQLTLSHANGLFLTMIFAIFACFGILVGEHLMYYWVVPKLRNKKRTSFWRSFTLMYLSQRLYRILNSEELLRPTQVLKEMLEVIKRLEFSRIFQKSARKKRFRKITIAEFVQQVKDEKDKALPDIVVQTKGLNRARKAWKNKNTSSSHLSSTTTSFNESIEETTPTSTPRVKKSFCLPNPETQKLVPSPRTRHSSMQLETVQHQLVSSSSASLSSMHQTLELTLKHPFVSPKSIGKVDYSKSDVEKKRVSFHAVISPRLSRTNAFDLNKPSTSARRVSRPPTLPPISDLTPSMRWQWLRSQMNTRKTEAKRARVLSVYKEEMGKLVVGRKRLEETVTDLCSQLEQIKRERDRLLLIEKLEHASTV